MVLVEEILKEIFILAKEIFVVQIPVMYVIIMPASVPASTPATSAVRALFYGLPIATNGAPDLY